MISDITQEEISSCDKNMLVYRKCHTMQMVGILITELLDLVLGI
jgi:hypothetical protein